MTGGFLYVPILRNPQTSTFEDLRIRGFEDSNSLCFVCQGPSGFRVILLRS